MKLKILRIAAVILSAAIFFNACKKDQDNDSNNNNPNFEVPSDPGLYISQPGVPIGPIAVQTIGPAGGVVETYDGKVRLEIPAGALNANTEISISEISNTGPWGIGNAYRFTPSGLVFNGLASLTIAYADDDLQGYPEEFLWITTQASNGSWKANIRSAVNPANNTVSCPMKHFSDWAVGRFIELSLNPSNPSVKVNNMVSLFVSGFKYQESDEDDYLCPLVVTHTGNDDELAPLVPVTGGAEPMNVLQVFEITGWSLNGTMAPVQSAAGNLTTNAKVASYKAPGQVPSNNPVAVTVHLKANNEQGGVSNFLVTTHINVIDDALYFQFQLGGTTHRYLQYGFNNQVPSDPANAAFVSCMGDNSFFEVAGVKFFNNVGNQFPLSLYVHNPSVGNRLLRGSNINGDDDFYFMNGDASMTFPPVYSINWRKRTFTDFCEEELFSANISITIKKYESTNGIVEASFNGKLYLNPENASSNCVSDIPFNVSGHFRLKILEP